LLVLSRFSAPQKLGRMTPHQLSLLNPGPALPPGLRYRPDLISTEEERELVGQLAALPFRAFEFQGYLGKRRVISFGWQYDFSAMQIRKAEDLPPFLLDLRERAAVFAGLAPSDLQQVLLTEYAPGAGIGWHKDKPMFAEVVGLSLLSRCVFRLRRKTGATWERSSLVLEPRSAYLLQGASRTEWEHSIPAVDSLRYSVTFRTFRSEQAPARPNRAQVAS
jgi:alkylated DNA repair dioxygenase AlkB